MANELGSVAFLELDEMAKAKAKAPTNDDTPKTLFSIKGRPSWHAWLKAYANSIGMDSIGAIDNALRLQAKADGFPDPMPRRIG